MENITPTTVPEWGTLIETVQDTNLTVKETNQLTQMLREEQHKEFKAMKEERRQQKDDFRKEMRDIKEAQEIRNQRLRDYDQFLTRWREESLRDMAEHRERMKETDKRLDRISKMQVEDRLQQQETNRLQKETDRLQKETNRMQKETDRLQKETYAQMKETDKKIKELATRFSTTIGNIIEGLMSSSATEMFQRAGYDMHSKAKNISRKSKNPNEGMEVDVILYNDTTLIALEVKASCGKGDIDRFLQQMEKFRRLFPLYADKEVLVSIAAVNYENDADKYAHERGLIVVRTDSYNFFSIDPCDKEKLLRF